MYPYYRPLLKRLKALLLPDATRDLEFQLDLKVRLVVRAAERKADLLRRAAAYEQEGLTGIAADLRRQAEAIDLLRPLETRAPSFESNRTDSPPPQPSFPSARENVGPNSGEVSPPKPASPGDHERPRKKS
jgi:hypothetical protein